MEKYKEMLIKAIDFSIENELFHSLNIIEKANCVCIWGCGELLYKSYDRMIKKRNIKVDYIVDSDASKQGKPQIDNIICISPEQLLQLKEPVVIPYVYNGFEEICDFCSKNNIAWIHKSHFMLDMQDADRRETDWFKNQKSKILNVYDSLEDLESKRVYSYALSARIAHNSNNIFYNNICSEGEYFNPSVEGYELNSNESFLDVGAFNGDTIQRFLEITRGVFSNIYALEMSKNNYKLLQKYIYGLPLENVGNGICKTYNYGAWNEHCFTTCGDEKEHSGIACSVNKGKRDFLLGDEIETVELDKIDNIIGKQEVTLIKMDIEGAEVNAILGAEECIKQNSPKLAICIYHNLSDYWEVPLAIKRCNPNYKLAVRHHSNDNGGTVCYAWI